ncbi:MFS transporter [Kibdelosporangium philippinense]|uniref:MFS transporter n=1 Tax=Kibdelosporangium philippinense TaxID=211113 RepID=A0ABS8Z841_9PSEU|nr:MFS transporter [Kibdelosporangium philippinense]MCE7004034.1 MFS transporter [Kibdelosporangium philippinense]
MSTIRAARSLPRTVQLLLLNQFGVNLGFYLLVPYLATHLRENLHLATGVVGAIIGARCLSQQGLTLFGGSAADRIGCRPLIITGCALRAVGFGAFAFLDNVPGLLAAALVTGVAGAVFSPATRAYLAVESGSQRLRAFALFNVAGEAGTLLGPLLGGILLAVEFRVVATTAAAVFALLTIAQALTLPARAPRPVAQSVLADWREMGANRHFLLFICATSGLFVLYNQLYLTLPLEVSRVSGMDSAVAVLFIASTLVTLCLQVRITDWCQRHWEPATAIGVGLTLCGLAFAPLAITGSLQPTAAGTHDDGIVAVLGSLPAIFPAILATIVLTLGVAVAQPFVLDRTPAFGRGALTGTYLGANAMAGGLAAAIGNTVVGCATDLGIRLDMPWLPWTLLVGYGLSCAVLIGVLRVRAAFPDQDRS